jgi:choline kinase
MYKLFIPSAGLGTRVRMYSKFENKSLITIGDKPAIAHVIDSTPSNVEVVVALGHGASYVRQVLDAFYGGIRRITYVTVDKYEGPGSGLGYTLSCAREHLQCPFIFSTNDTVLPGHDMSELYDPNSVGNWVMYCDRDGDTSQYRTIDIANGRMASLNPKGADSKHVYVGVAGIHDWKTFWSGMNGPDALESGESYGLKYLSNVKAFMVRDWYDVGNPTSLREAKTALASTDHTVLEKESEAIWFSYDRVIKFSVDGDFIADRVERLKYLPRALMPKIISNSQNVYTYAKIPGTIFSKRLTRSNFRTLFKFMNDSVWNSGLPKGDARIDMTHVCREFYEVKTVKRVKQFFTSHEMADVPMTINGTQCPSVKDALAAVDWNSLCDDPRPGHYHGDFHNENILMSETGKFVLLDWRQDFGGDLEFGDVYYDLAKYLHGLIVSHSAIAEGRYQVDTSERSVSIDTAASLTMNEVRDEFDSWLTANGYDRKKVYVLCALVFLNIAPLHEYPYSLFLHYLGRYMLEVYS